MDVKDIISSVTERVKETANVRVVFGDPLQAGELTLIPVACVKVAGGGGSGSNKSNADSGEKDYGLAGDSGSGIGLGLQVVATPIGYIEIKGGEARFVDIIDKNKLALVGAVIGGALLLTAAKLLTWKVKHR